MTLEFLAPPPARPLPRARRVADRAELLRLQAEPAKSPRRRRRWFAGFGVVAFLATGSGMVATALVLHEPQPATVQNSARCYAEVSSDFSFDFPGVSVEFVPEPGQPEQTDRKARSLCSLMWSTATLPDPSAEPVEDAPVPPLVACVLPDGQVGVFPGTGPICARLDLPPLLEDA